MSIKDAGGSQSKRTCTYGAKGGTNVSNVDQPVPEGLVVGTASEVTRGDGEPREPVDFEVARQVAAKQLQPALLGFVGELFPSTRTFEFEFCAVLKMVNHLMNEH